MKKVLCLVLGVMLVTSPVFAAFTGVSVSLLKDTSGVDISSYALTSGSSVNTAPILVDSNIGFATIIVTEDKSGGAGSVNIYAEYSDDAVTWYRPYVSDMAGTTTIEGNIVTAIGNTVEWIVFTPRMAPYTRLVLSPSADSQVTVKLVFQEDR